MFRNALLLTLLGVLMAVSAPASLTQNANGAVVVLSDSEETEDVVIFSSGRVVRGDILEETDSTIIMNVRIGSMPEVRTVYQKDEILEINRDVPRETESAKEEAQSESEEVVPDTNTRGENINDDTTLFYYAELRGLFERDLTHTPITRLFEDVDRVFDDLVEVPSGSGSGTIYQVDQSKRDKHVVVLKLDASTDLEDPNAAMQGVFEVENVTPILKEQIQKGRRIVFWVERAEGGAAYFPWITPEMYITPDSLMWSATNLDAFDMGDPDVNAKQISLRMGHMEGLAIYGGYGRLGVAIIQAMTRGQYWFFVRLSGAEPEYYISTEKPGPEILENPQWILLSDNGQDEYEDDPDEKLYTDDIFYIRNDMLLKLGIADGVASSLEDIAVSMRVFRNYAVLKNTKARDILRGWQVELARAENNFDRAIFEARTIEVGLGGDAVLAALGRMRNYLRQARSILQRYAEVLDPNGARAANLAIEIELIEARMRNLRNGGNDRPGGGGGAGGGGAGR